MKSIRRELQEEHYGVASEFKFYRKKPIVIRAILWTGYNLEQVIQFIGGLHKSVKDMAWADFEVLVKKEGLKIFTLEGKHLASIGDYIVEGVKGEHYPCKPDIFEATYEEVIE